jgi:hypothetical protein
MRYLSASELFLDHCCSRYVLLQKNLLSHSLFPNYDNAPTHFPLLTLIPKNAQLLHPKLQDLGCNHALPPHMLKRSDRPLFPALDQVWIVPPS